MLLGATLLLDRTGVIDAFDYAPFWPVVVITIGLVKLSHRGDDRRRHGGWWVLFGVAMLLHEMDMLRGPGVLAAVHGRVRRQHRLERARSQAADA